MVQAVGNARKEQDGGSGISGAVVAEAADSGESDFEEGMEDEADDRGRSALEEEQEEDSTCDEALDGGEDV